MDTRRTGALLRPQTDLTAVSEAAISTCARLMAAAKSQIRTHPSRDGGLICEDRSNRARPRLWRITANGALLADISYSFARRAFVSLPRPQEAPGR